MIFKTPSHRHHFGITAAFCLVALRLAVGWHFFTDGTKKLDPDFRSSWFLQQAKGPFAEQFFGLIPDRFGVERLDAEHVTRAWPDFRERAARQFDFDERQQADSERILKQNRQRLGDFFAANRGEIEQHRLEVARLEKARRAPLAQVEFQRDWILDRDLELQTKAAPWIASVSAVHEAYQDEILAIADGDSRLKRLPGLTDKTWVDHAVTWTTIVVGACLLLGLCTRVAAIAGAVFLVSVLMTQPFLVGGTNLMMFPYQLVELCALLFLAAVAAGRYAGLDFIWWAIRHREYVVD